MVEMIWRSAFLVRICLQQQRVIGREVCRLGAYQDLELVGAGEGDEEVLQLVRHAMSLTLDPAHC